MRKVTELLSEPCCELFQPLFIHYHLTEVKVGVCWSMKNRSFVESLIEKHQVGRALSRALCAYNPERGADP